MLDCHTSFAIRPVVNAAMSVKWIYFFVAASTSAVLLCCISQHPGASAVRNKNRWFRTSVVRRSWSTADTRVSTRPAVDSTIRLSPLDLSRASTGSCSYPETSAVSTKNKTLLQSDHLGCIHSFCRRTLALLRGWSLCRGYPVSVLPWR